MFGIIVGLIVLVLLAVLFGWLTGKAWRARGAWTKWLGAFLAGLFTLIFALLSVLGALGTYKIFRSNKVSVPQVTVAGTPEQIARGEHIAQVLCAGCHSLNGDLPLSGGKNLSADAGLPLGDIYAPNLTPATDIKDWLDSDLFRTIRTGVDDQGRATAMTAVVGVHALSDEDTLAVIAYLRQSPAVVNETPEFKPSIVMALVAGAGLIPMDVPATVSAVSVPPKAATVEYGKYVLTYMDCTSCHGENFDGAVAPPYPAGPDIRNYFSRWSKDDFFNVVHAFAASAQPSDVMPWRDISRLDEVEREALYLYLHQATSQ
jgi:mono/diheme cytochrome c family protein